MKKKFLTLVAVLVLAFACVTGIAACNGGNNPGGGGGTTVTVGGTYYLYENGETYSELYITFKNGKWTDDEGVSGSYTLSDADITLYIELDGEKDEYASGTVSGDDITLKIMGADTVYRKGEDIDGKPKEKMLNLALSDDKSYYIVKGIGGLTGDIVIPDEYKRKPVQEIAENAFASCSELTSITISDNVTTMGKKAFYKCANLTEVDLGDGITAVEESTFESCSKLEKITVGSSVIKFGTKAFYSCLELESIYYNGTASDWAGIEFVSNPLSDNNIYIVGNNTAYATHRSRDFYIDNELLVNATITDAEKISDSAFFGYVRLENVTIGGSVDEIGENAFYGCSSLETLEVTGGVKSIGKLAFGECDSLTTVSISDSVKTIGEKAFNACENLTTVRTGNGVTYIAKGAFMACEKLSSLTLGSSISEICEDAFYSCHALESVTIPSSVIFIGKNAFFATGITSATFKNADGWMVDKAGGYEAVENLDDATNAATLLKNGLLMQTPGYADYDWEKPTLQYTLSSDKTYYIVNNNGATCRSEIVIPETYKEIPIRALASGAFGGCTSLKSISLPGCMMDIPNDAFSGCTALESIEIRGYLVSDYDEVYASRDGMLYNADFTELLYIPLGKSEITITGLTEIPDYMFADKTTLKNVVIGSGVTSIGAGAFAGCTNLKSIVIPDTVTSIGYEAFSYCNKLQYIKKGNALYLGNDENPYVVLMGIQNKEVASFSIIDKTKIIYDGALSDCRALTSIEIPNGVTSIGTLAFEDCKNLTNITIPNSVTSIGVRAFYYCSGLTSAKIPNSVTSIGAGAFLNCSKLTSVTIPDGITQIAYETFKDCSSLTSIVIPNSVKSIESSAFRNCSHLTSIVIPNGVTSIGSCAFMDCSSLTSIEIPSTVTSISDDGTFAGCGSLSSITVKSGNTKYHSSGNCLIETESKTLLAGSNNSIIPDDGSVIAIKKYAFSGLRGLKSVEIPMGITTIEESTFSGCNSLTSIKIPNSVTSIKSSAFMGCGSLTSVTIPDSVIDIGWWAFGVSDAHFGAYCLTIYCEAASAPVGWDSNWSHYCSVVWDCNNNDKDEEGYVYTVIDGVRYGLKDGKATVVGQPSNLSGAITLQSSVTYNGANYSVTIIESDAFIYNVNITSIEIPVGVVSIGEHAFYGCNGLKNITYKGTVAQWNAIEKGYEFDNGMGEYVVTCTDGKANIY